MPQDKYSKQERIFMVKKFIRTESIVQTQAAFLIQFPYNTNNAPTIKKALEDFEINGCVNKEYRKI